MGISLVVHRGKVASLINTHSRSLIEEQLLSSRPFFRQPMQHFPPKVKLRTIPSSCHQAAIHDSQRAGPDSPLQSSAKGRRTQRSATSMRKERNTWDLSSVLKGLKLTLKRSEKPTTVQGIQPLEFCNFYRRFIKYYRGRSASSPGRTANSALTRTTKGHFGSRPDYIQISSPFEVFTGNWSIS
jgi:hypothetical protein